MILPAFLEGLIWSLLFIANNPAKTEMLQSGELQSRPNHLMWEEVLIKYVDDSGNVNYKELTSDPGPLLGYLDHMSENPPAPTWTRADSLAYYINLYNAATVKLILNNYPLTSITDINKPWDKKWIKYGGELISLGEIEHKILRKMNEPRIHFAINCASFSCPKLLNEAYTEDKLHKQLDKVTKDFINDPSRNIISENKVELSKIFKWYKKDFENNGSLIAYLNQYLKSSINPDAKIEYIKYNWSLNETK